MFTDYVLMAELLIISVLLLRSRNVVTWDPVLGRNVVTRGSWRDSPIRNQFWAAGCFLLALSFAAGGTEHGFALYLKCAGRDQCIGSSWVWVATLLLQTPGLALPNKKQHGNVLRSTGSSRMPSPKWSSMSRA